MLFLGIYEGRDFSIYNLLIFCLAQTRLARWHLKPAVPMSWSQSKRRLEVLSLWIFRNDLLSLPRRCFALCSLETQCLFLSLDHSGCLHSIRAIQARWIQHPCGSWWIATHCFLPRWKQLRSCRSWETLETFHTKIQTNQEPSSPSALALSF